MENRDVQILAERLLDQETVRRPDIFQIDAAERRAEVADAIDERIDVFGVDQNVDAVDVGEALEQYGLAFHDRLRRHGAEISHAENRRAIGHNGHEVAFVGVVVCEFRIIGDRLDRHGDARRIGKAQVMLRGHRFGRRNFQLPRLALVMELQRFLRGKSDFSGCECHYACYALKGRFPVCLCRSNAPTSFPYSFPDHSVPICWAQLTNSERLVLHAEAGAALCL